MPQEYEFMKKRDEKEMSDEEYKSLCGEYNQQIKKLRNSVKLLVFIFIGLYVVSLVFINIYNTAELSWRWSGPGYAGFFGYNWVAVEFVLLLFLHEPKNNDEKIYKYETEKNSKIKSLQNRIRRNKIRLGCVICMGAIFIILNAVAWWLLNINSAAGL